MIDTYTMLYDSFVADLGLLRAAVLCAVLRYGSLRDGLCRASLRTIARRLHLSVGMVHRTLKQLVAEGYLQDLTPDLRNAPHRYRDTGRLRHRLPAAADSATRPAPAPQPPSPPVKAAGPAPQPPCPPVNAAEQDAHAAAHPVNATVQPTNATVQDVNATVHVGQERRLLRDTKDTPEDTPVPAPQAPAAPELILVRQACGHMPLSWNHEAAVKAVRQMGQRLGRAPAPSDLLPFWEEWLRRGYHATNDAWLTDWARLGMASRIQNDSLSKARWNASQPASSHRPCASNVPGQARQPAERPGAARANGGRLSPSEHDRLVRFYNGLAAA